VVVDEIDIEGSSLLEAEDDPSVGGDGDGDASETREIAGKRMQTPAGVERHLAGLPDPVQDRQDASDLVGILGGNAAPDCQATLVNSSLLVAGLGTGRLKHALMN